MKELKYNPALTLNNIFSKPWNESLISVLLGPSSLKEDASRRCEKNVVSPVKLVKFGALFSGDTGPCGIQNIQTIGGEHLSILSEQLSATQTLDSETSGYVEITSDTIILNVAAISPSVYQT